MIISRKRKEKNNIIRNIRRRGRRERIKQKYNNIIIRRTRQMTRARRREENIKRNKE